MKAKLLLLTVVIVVLTGGRAHALPNKTFTSSGQILPGEEWENVYIYNDDTIVDMLGGSADSIGAYDESTLNVLAGYVSTLTALELSTVNVSGGEVYGLDAWNYSTINFYDGATAVSFGASGFGTVNMTGGTTDYLGAIDSGTVNLYGGLVTVSLGVGESATANIFGYDLVKISSGGTYGYGQVYGYWLDDTPFTINLNGSETYSHIVLIPEPLSLLMLGTGALFLRRRR